VNGHRCGSAVGIVVSGIASLMMASRSQLRVIAVALCLTAMVSPLHDTGAVLGRLPQAGMGRAFGAPIPKLGSGTMPRDPPEFE
jgi:hypothetical protein